MRWSRLKKRVWTEPDRGWVGLWMVLAFVALMAMAGLVFDGGQALRARGDAASAAGQAARAGADAMGMQAARFQGRVQVDPAVAQRAAEAALAAAGVEGSVVVSGNLVMVTAHVERPAVLLQMVGVQSVSGTSTETAIAVLGVTTEGGL